MIRHRTRSVTEFVWLALAFVIAAAGPSQAQPGPVVTEYYHVDAVGSVRVVTNDQGAVVRRYDFAPFGEQDSPCTSSPDARLFTGHERDRETCLDYMGARYYRSTDGRFLTLDPALDASAALVDPQRWNRYAYANNNPLRYVDPDGREIAVLVGGRWIGAGLESVAPSASNGNREFAILAGVASGAVLGPLAFQAATSLCLLNPVACIGTATGILEGLAGAPPGSSSLRWAFHHTVEEAARGIASSGLRAGSYATPTASLTPSQAMTSLALDSAKGIRNVVVEIDIEGLRAAGYAIPKITKVRPQFGLPGGGYEMRFPYPIPPEFLKIP